MLHTKVRLLIVDDEPSIRVSLSFIFTQLGYSVRCAEDGLSALRQIRREQPEILLSDLNMPRMSGFELFSAVRRQFPAIHTIAMSGAFSGIEVPSGVDADVFYEKGSGMDALLQLFRTLPKTNPPALQPHLMGDVASLQLNGSATSSL
jgi:CheY-like chemotaxis protein